MKNIFRIGFFFLIASTISITAMASPFLVCDPYPVGALQPTEFRIIYGTATVTSAAQTMADGSRRLNWDLGVLVPGTYNVTVTAVAVDPTWGTVESTPAPFTFTKPAQAAITPPANLRLLK
jgi:hypothetical protein